MSIIIYSTCRMQYTLNNKQNPEREYSDRTLIELRESGNQGFALRALDIEHNKTEIFNFPIKDHNQYQFGLSDSQPDQINASNGTYLLWLNKDTRDAFHQTYCAILEASSPENSRSDQITTSPSYMESPKETKYSLSDPIDYKESPKERKIPIPDPINCNPKDILTDVRNLSKFIEQGQADEAVRLTKQLISQGIHLEVTSLKQFPNENEFRINIQFDGNEYSINQNGGTIPMNVFPSTTIRELRAAFQVAYQYPPSNQYFFVNGKLAYDNSTMRDLNVGPNSLFVLFLLAYPKQFKAQGPWKCSACETQNQQDNLKCRICSASRME